MVTVRKITIKGKATTVVVTPEPVKEFWSVVEAYEAPLKAREDLVDWDRDGSVAEFKFEGGETVLVKYEGA